MTAAPFRCTGALDRSAAEEFRRHLIFSCCKWDPRVEDHESVADFAIVLEAGAWRFLAESAERLHRETIEAERELLGRPELLGSLNLPRPIRRRLERLDNLSASREGPRVMRFDFHWTSIGWRISEVNADVPGGFNEAAGAAQFMEPFSGAARSCGHPGRAWAESVALMIGTGHAGLVHATSYTDDHQVMVLIARELSRAGVTSSFIAPDQVLWRNGEAMLRVGDASAKADVLLRFFPAEWLPNLRDPETWLPHFAGSRTPLSNPAHAIAVQSKRFPLIWDRLSTQLESWRALLPETRDPREADWLRSDRWILKPALGRVGEDIGIRGVTPAKRWRRIALDAILHPSRWIAQECFETSAVDSPEGPVRPCIGVYTVDGRAAGAYGRFAPGQLIDFRARDVAVLAEYAADEIREAA